MDATPIIEGMDKGWARVLPIKIPTAYARKVVTASSGD